MLLSSDLSSSQYVLAVFDQGFHICRPLTSGQRGEVYEVNGDRVAVILDIVGDSKVSEGEKDDKVAEQSTKPLIYWIDGNIL